MRCPPPLHHLARYSTRSRAPQLFDERAKVMQKARSAAAADAAEYDYLRDEFADRLVSRIGDVRRHFGAAVDLGCGSGHIRRALEKNATARDTVGELLELDAHANSAGRHAPGLPAALPLPDDSADLVLSSWWLHWVNDLGGTLRDCARVLRPDGALLGCMAAASTLHELRVSLQLAETQLHGGVAVRVSPFVRPPDVGGVLGAAGLALATVDSDRLIVRYADMRAVMRHLRGAGESNAAVVRRPLGRDVLKRAEEIYTERFSHPLGGVTATFEIVNFIAWKPAAGQQVPLARGAAQFSLADLVTDPPQSK